MNTKQRLGIYLAVVPFFAIAVSDSVESLVLQGFMIIVFIVGGALFVYGNDNAD